MTSSPEHQPASHCATTILVADDDRAHRTMLRVHLSGAGYRVIEAADGDEVLPILTAEPVDLLLLDLKMPRQDGIATLEAMQAAGIAAPTIVITAFSSVDSAVAAMKRGAADYVTKPVDIDELLLTIRKVLDHQRLQEENRHLRQRLDERFAFDNIIGRSKPMQELFATLEMVAPTDATVLITGESGTGKELVANAIHQHSARKRGPFVAVNCAALHEELLESELFGHERGAFTGATTLRRGRFEQADGGTLFLDEIGDMSPATQAKILRVLQEGTFERLGGDATITVDVRLVAATHKDLEKMVAEGSFRQDLYFRLNVVPVRLPSLRERPEDIPELALHFLRRYAEKNRKDIKGITPPALQLLLRYPWPGNIRELENCIERAVILCPGEQITPADLPPQVQAAPAEAPLPPRAAVGLSLRDMERELIRSTLEATGYNKSQTAKILGIARQTLLNKIREYGLEAGPGAPR